MGIVFSDTPCIAGLGIRLLAGQLPIQRDGDREVI